ncbi:MAG: glycosyltransferase family 4 protein [Actinobacteria bacterium]|nr:glycosyltransferase family 4 protein [Actinomycetota bacterium]
MAGEACERPRVLVLLGTDYFPPFIDDLAMQNRAGQGPRAWLLELPLDLTLLDQRFRTNPPKWRLALYRRIPIWAAQIAEAFRVRRDYDAIFAWGAEPVAMPFALLLKLSRSQVPFVTLFSWISAAKKAWFLRLAHSYITKLILPPQTQQQFAITQLGIPPEKVVDIPWGIDEQFWQPPAGVTQDMICAVGREMRDYETLIKALDGTGIPCHIAGGLVRGKRDRWRRSLGDSGEKAELPPNVTIGPKNALGLRELYARSRFVVLPLYQSDTDNGVTCMLEAWSMSRPVICTMIEGQRGAIDHGRDGLYTPVGDAEALRKAIVGLWEQPEETARMGQEGRRTVVRRNSLDRFVAEISAVLRDAAAAGR